MSCKRRVPAGHTGAPPSSKRTVSYIPISFSLKVRMVARRRRGRNRASTTVGYSVLTGDRGGVPAADLPQEYGALLYTGDMKAAASNLRRELKRLFRSMTFVSRQPALSRRGMPAERFADVYQQLGMLWEFLALQCGHAEGWRKTREGAFVCRTCGTVRNVAEDWVLLPRHRRKIIGHRLFPNSSQTFRNKKAASIVDDSIDFHGVKVAVSVHNAYRSRIRRDSSDITIAADRIVRVNEDGIECWIDTHLAEIRIRKRMRSAPPPYHAFVSELPKRALKRFPLLVAYDAQGKLVGVTIFKPAPVARRKKIARTTSRQKRIRRKQPPARPARDRGAG